MKMNHGMLLALGAAALATTVAGSGAAAQRGRGNTHASATSFTCASGAQPSAATNAAQATYNRSLIPGLAAAMKNGYYQQSYDAAMTAAATDANNPFNYYLAAQAAVGLGRVAQADSLFARTVQLCPEAAGEIAPARAQLGEQAMEAARVALTEKNDTATAIRNWQLAAQLDTTNRDATFYAGYFSYLHGNSAAAVPVFRRILSGPAPAATDTSAIQRRDVAVRILLGYGGDLFNKNQNQEAVDVLNAVLAADPHNHDAAYWKTLALYKMEKWDDLATAAPASIALGPLNYNEFMLEHDAQRMIADRLKAQNQAAQEAQHRNAAVQAQSAGDALPVQIENVGLNIAQGTATVHGTAKAGHAAAGTPVRVEFTLSTPNGDVGKGTVNIAAPAAGGSTDFSAPIQVTDTPTGFRYRVVP